MDRAARAGLLAGPPRAFASNTLTIVVRPGNPKGVKGFADLVDASLVMCAVQVPCGAALPQLQRAAGVRLAPVSEESSVSDVLNKVTSGQADAGLVYVTDARGAGDKVDGNSTRRGSDAPDRRRVTVLLRDRPAATVGDQARWR